VLRFSSLIGMSLMLGLTLAAGAADKAADVREWEVPWPETRPRDPAVGPDGRIWFVGQRGDYVAVFDPASESFNRYRLEAGTGPHTVITDERGAWYAGNRADHIGRVHPDSGRIDQVRVPQSGRQDPHTMAFTRQGHIWFTNQMANRIGRLNTDNGAIKLFQPSVADARPYGLALDADDRPWVALFGTNRLATVDPGSGEVREVQLPRAHARPRRLAITGDGRIWYVDYAQGFLGHYDPDSERFREWRTPAGLESGPYGLAADGQGRLWFVETGVSPNRVVGFRPGDETFTEPVPVPSGGGTVRNMVHDAERGVIWFGADTNTIGRAELPP